MMRLNHSSHNASQRLNSIRFLAKDTLRLLTFALIVFLLICLFPNIATAASPHIYDLPKSGPPGSQTTTVGNGWDPNAALDIYFDNTDVGLVATDKDGSFGMALKAPTLRQNGFVIQIPKDAAPDQHWITAIERITQLQAQVPFTVQFDWPQPRFDTQNTGFNPYESVLSSETVSNLTTRWRYPIQTGQPTVAGGVLYASAVAYQHKNNLYALDANTGALLWNYPPPSWNGGGAAVVKGIAYVSTREAILALNATSGATLWSYPLGVTTPPLVANGVVYVGCVGCPSGNSVFALNADTGALLWGYATEFYVDGVAVANGVVYVTSRNYVYALDGGTGALLWKTPGLLSWFDPVVANGVVYVMSDVVYALNASTGAVIWNYNPGPITGVPAVMNGVVYVPAYYDLVALDAGTGAPLWKCQFNYLLLMSPVVANGVVYVGSEIRVYAVDASTGVVLWKYTTGSGVGSLAVVNGMIYTSTGDYLYAFGLTNQQMAEKFSPPERPDPARLTPNWSPQPSRQVSPPLKK